MGGGSSHMINSEYVIMMNAKVTDLHITIFGQGIQMRPGITRKSSNIGCADPGPAANHTHSVDYQ